MSRDDPDVFRYFGGVASAQKGEVLPLGDALLSYSVREPLGVLKMAEVCWRHLPEGVLNVVTGYGEETGGALLNHPGIAKITFTGSTEVGRIAMRAAAERVLPVSLELGGKAPAIVYADCDDDATVQHVIAAMRFARQGQSCTAGSRLFVHASIFDSFTGRLTAALERMVVGDALDEASDIGSLINGTQDARVCGYVREALEKGAVALTGGLPDDERPGYQLPPTALCAPRTGLRPGGSRSTAAAASCPA